MRTHLLLPCILPLALVTIVSRAAWAQSSEVCSVAYARGQEERLAGRLFNARTAFQRCASAACSAALASDCDRWVKEVEADLPTIRVTVRTEQGRAARDLKVFIDGNVVPLTALSAPIVLEAGPHELRFEAPGYDPVRLEKALRPSDREAEVAVILRPPQVSAPAPVAGRQHRPVPPASWVLAGAGAVALGGCLYFGVKANDQYQALKRSCAPSCETSASDRMWRDAVISDVALLGSVVAFAASAAIYFTRPAQPSADVALRIEAAAQGGRAHFLLSF
jgi:hypothetical protein